MTGLEQWQKLSVMQRRVAVGASLLAGVWLIDRVGLAPLRRDLHQLHQQVEEAEQRLSRAVSVNTQATAIRAAFEAYRPYVPTTAAGGAEAAAIPEDAVRSQGQVQSDVEAAVRASGITLLNVKPLSGGPHAIDTTVSVGLELEATPAQLITLLDGLQRSTQLLKVTQMALRLTDEHAATLRCSMVITKLLLPVFS